MQNELATFTAAGFRNVDAPSMREAAEVFANRQARKEFGSRGSVRLCNQQSYAQDGSLAEYEAFIGITRGNATTGHNFHFTVSRA